MKVRSQREIREQVLLEFEREFPGEHICTCVSGQYMLHRLVDLIEKIDLYRFFRETDNLQ